MIQTQWEEDGVGKADLGKKAIKIKFFAPIGNRTPTA